MSVCILRRKLIYGIIVFTTAPQKFILTASIIMNIS
jgi:hypothetical protein